jgi:hypothetical protein
VSSVRPLQDLTFLDDKLWCYEQKFILLLLIFAVLFNEPTKALHLFIKTTFLSTLHHFTKNVFLGLAFIFILTTTEVPYLPNPSESTKKASPSPPRPYPLSN